MQTFNIKHYILLLIITSPLISNDAFSDVSRWTVEFGPFAGGGKISNQESIRHVSGFNVGLVRNWKVGSLTSIAPRIEITNSYISTRSNFDSTSSISSYDNRIVSGSAVINQKLREDLPWSVFLALGAGIGRSKLDVNESTSSSFTQSHNNGIPGNYRSLEVGTHIDFSGSELGMNISIAGTVYELDQSKTIGSIKEERRSATEGILLTEKTLSAEDQGLTKSLTQKLLSIKIGLAMGL